MSAREKILSLEQLPAWRYQLREDGRKLVVTNGCFDLLHGGSEARKDGAAIGY